MNESSLVLDYGRDRPTRWRRLIRWTVVALLLVTLAFAGLFALRKLSIVLARRAGYHDVAAWYELARATTQPAGTLLYTEDHADLSPGEAMGRSVGSPNGQRFYRSFGSQFPTLRVVRFRGDTRVPIVVADDVLYAHEHLLWDAPTGARPAVVCVSYRGLTAAGHPEFFVTSYRVNPIADKLWFPFMGSTTHVHEYPGRSLARLRIFAGAPNPTDKRRFALPFDCDGGRGRFEFRTDVDVSDGGMLAPDVWIEWDDAATRPTTKAADAR